MRTDWNPALRAQLERPYWAELQAFVAAERERAVVYPPADQVFAALHLTSLAATKVVILGQDPYHGPGQAHGLCFSVLPPVPPPPSLHNVFTELVDDLGVARPTSGDLRAWAAQGVLLLNSVLTVRAGQAGSHAGKGWETFTDEVLKTVNDREGNVVFVLWGAYARSKKPLIDRSRHGIVESPHPSPLSARNGFFGSRPFSRVNALLAERGVDGVDWALPPIGKTGSTSL